MKNFTIHLILIIFAFFGFFNVLQAATFDTTMNVLKDVGKKSGYKTEGVTETSLASTLGTIVQTVLGLLGIVFTLLVIYGGVIWMTAQGDEQKVTKAKDIIKNSAIGLAIVVASLLISQFIMSVFTESIGTATTTTTK